MSIKSISLLNQYNNDKQVNQMHKNIGGTLGGYASNGKSGAEAEATVVKATNPFDPTDECKGPNLALNENNYFNTLFEVSKPAYKGSNGNPKTCKVYESQKITYEDLARNIIFDTKQYLNTRNNLLDHNLCAICNGKYYFNGHKYFNNDVDIAQNLSVRQDLTVDGKHVKFTNIDVDAYFDCNLSSRFNKNVLILKNLVVSGETTLSGVTRISSDLSVLSTIYSSFLSGYAYGLKDNRDTLTEMGEKNNTYEENDGPYYKPTTDFGFPVYFKDGRPDLLSGVYYAKYAYNLIDSYGGKYNSGDGTHPVYFKDGIPISTDTIEYAKLAYSAWWSDLGERYVADQQYEPGTLVQFGGEKEITIATKKVNAIVSTKAFELNCKLEGGTTIALCGRVPTKIIGKISRFDKVTLSEVPGVGRKKKWYELWKKTIGISLGKSEDEDVKLVECVTRVNI